jgi:hypothetical protein
LNKLSFTHTTPDIFQLNFYETVIEGSANFFFAFTSEKKILGKHFYYKVLTTMNKLLGLKVLGLSRRSLKETTLHSAKGRRKERDDIYPVFEI